MNGEVNMKHIDGNSASTKRASAICRNDRNLTCACLRSRSLVREAGSRDVTYTAYASCRVDDLHNDRVDSSILPISV